MTLSRKCFGIFGGAAVVLGGCTHIASAQDLSREAQARFLNQVTALEAEKNSRTPAQRKLASALVLSLQSRRTQVAGLGALRASSAIKAASGAPKLRIKGEITGNLLLAIRRAGGQVLESWPKQGVVYATLTPSQAEQVAALPEVHSIDFPPKAGTNVLTSEGDRTHRADNARKNFNATGKGLKIGVLSDSVDHLKRSQNAGELPNVTVLPGQSGTPDEFGLPRSGEGTAMLEIIHDLVPDAQLYFATAFTGKEQFAQNILDLRKAGCDIIVDDVYYFDEAPFQDDVLAQAVNTVVNDGALYFSSAGNAGNLNSGTSGCWEGDFKASAATLTGSGPGTLHDWGGTHLNQSYNIGLGGDYGYLFWSDPLGRSKNDYDLYVVNSTGDVVQASNTTQDGTQDPTETVDVYPGDQVAVKLFKGKPRFLHFELISGKLSRATSGRTKGHSATEKAIGVSAAPANTPFDGFTSGPFPKAYNQFSSIETFTSDGPRRMFYAPDGRPFTAGPYVGSGAKRLQKPDITAADGVATSVPGFQPFFGTSAAAPHAAAIAAQVWSTDRSQSAAQVKQKLLARAIDIRSTGWDRDSGAGIVMAADSVKLALPGLTIGDVQVQEGAGVEATAAFPITLSRASEYPIVIQFKTEDITARGNVDYRIRENSMTIAAGQTKAVLNVPVYADSVTENNETFRISLLSATNARLDVASAVGTIRDNSSTAAASVATGRSAGQY